MAGNFDYKQFAEDLATQAQQLIPEDFQDFQKKYVYDTIKNFSIMSAEAVTNDEKLNFADDQTMFLTQIIAEWSFHKSIDLIRSGILPDYWDAVMKKIAFTIFEIAKQTISQGVAQDEVLQLVEHHVKKSYEAAIDELLARNVINEDVKNNAMSQSNIDKMMAEIQEQQAQQAAESGEAPPSAEEPGDGQLSQKSLKLATLALLLKNVKEDKVQIILTKFNEDEAAEIRDFMKTPDLKHRIDVRNSMKYLKEIKQNLPEPKQLSPTKILSKFKTLKERVGRERLVKMVKDERSNVRDFVKKAVSGEVKELSPKVTALIIEHLEDKIL